MKNKDMLVAALNGAIDDGGDTLKETIDHLIRCPYMSAYSLISYGHAHPLCADQDGTASRVGRRRTSPRRRHNSTRTCTARASETARHPPSRWHTRQSVLSSTGTMASGKGAAIRCFLPSTRKCHPAGS